jgi:hypothetical protein
VRKTRVVKTAAAAVVAGFPIAVGVVLLLDALQKRRKNRPARPTRDELDELDDDLEASAGADVPLPATTASSPDACGPAASPVYDDVPSTRTPFHEDAPIPAMAAAGVGVAAANLADEDEADDDEADEDEDVDPLDVEADLEAEEEAEADEADEDAEADLAVDAEDDEADAGEADADEADAEDEADADDVEADLMAVDEDEEEDEAELESVAVAEEDDEDEAELESVAVAEEDDEADAGPGRGHRRDERVHARRDVGRRHVVVDQRRRRAAGGERARSGGQGHVGACGCLQVVVHLVQLVTRRARRTVLAPLLQRVEQEDDTDGDREAGDHRSGGRLDDPGLAHDGRALGRERQVRDGADRGELGDRGVPLGGGIGDDLLGIRDLGLEVLDLGQ